MPRVALIALSSFGSVEEPDAMDNRPNPADNEESEYELKKSEKQGRPIEVIASAGRNHSTDSRRERDAI